MVARSASNSESVFPKTRIAGTLKKISDLLASLSVPKWGIADITSLHPLADTYPKAFSILLPYRPEFKTYSELAYHHLLKRVDSWIDDAVLKVSQIFKANEVKHFCVPQGGQDPDTLLAMFPHKLAAVRAGLGWIGKSSLFINREYGPRVRLATILVDEILPCSDPVTVSECGDCEICINACPYGCINGVNWFPGISRKALFDAHICSAKREAFRKSIGHKHECGLCLLACPLGNGSGKVEMKRTYL